MAEPDLVIFDCDGVLIDSEYLAAEVEAEVLTRAGFAISAGELAERFSGLAWADIVGIIQSEHRLSLPDDIGEVAKTAIDDRLARDLTIIEGTAEAVAGIARPKCICSNSSPERLSRALGKVGLLHVFQPHVFSATTLGEHRGKPKPDVFLHGAKAMGVPVGQGNIVVVEDSVHGVRGARTAGMRVVGFTGGRHTYPTHAARLLEAGAEMIVERMADLAAAIDAR